MEEKIFSLIRVTRNQKVKGLIHHLAISINGFKLEVGSGCSKMLLRYDSKIIESDVEHIFKKCLLVERLTQTHIIVCRIVGNLMHCLIILLFNNIH